MSQNGSQNILVDIIQAHAGRRSGLYSASDLLFCWDIDLTLADTMATNTTPAQQALFRELYLRMNGGMIVMTGRSSASVEKTLSGEYPGSFEHHSAMRIEQGGKVIPLAPTISTRAVGDEATKFIRAELARDRTGLRIATSPEEVRAAEGKFPMVYPEVKEFAVALVHSLSHGHETKNRELFERAARHTISALGLTDSHDVAIGSDAIEIVPKGLSDDSPAHDILPADQITRLQNKGLNKGQGIHNFMSLPPFKGASAWVIGDSSTDGRAMNKAHRYYDGGGIYVLNGKTVPAQFAAAVQGKTIENFMRTWDAIEEAVNYLRQRQKVFMVPSP